MRIGAHMPNAHITPDDLCAFRIGGFEAAKLMYTDGTKHTPQDVMRLRALGVKHFLVRLPDSVAPDGRWKGDEEWAEECITAIHAFGDVGVTDFQLDCEPNLTWHPLNNRKVAEAWRWLTGQVVGMIRTAPGVNDNVRLGLAPLAWNDKTYTHVENTWIPEQLQIAHLFDFICIHSYWQDGQYFNHPPYGGNCTEWHDKLMAGVDLPYVVTEWANTSEDPLIEMLRTKQYPAWLRWIATKPYVEGTYLWILGGTPDWAAHFPTDKVLRAIGTVIDTWQ